MSRCERRGDSAGFLEIICKLRGWAPGDGAYARDAGAAGTAIASGQAGSDAGCGSCAGTSDPEAGWRRDVCDELAFDFGLRGLQLDGRGRRTVSIGQGA